MAHVRLASVYLLGFLAVQLRAQDAAPSTIDPTTVKMDTYTVSGALDLAREDVVPELGASSFHIDQTQLMAQAQGLDASFNQVLLRAPGVAEDSFGQVHLRGEHADLQYRINDVLLPEGISGFGQELDTRFAGSISLLTGALPAQYGFRTAGIVDIHTKKGTIADTDELTIYGGSFGTFRPSFEVGGVEGGFSYYLTGSFTTSEIGIENPTPAYQAIHDHTDQYKGFGYFSYVLDAKSRIVLMVSGSDARFQIPDNPGQPAAFTLAGTPSFDSSRLNETQVEDTSYAIGAYQYASGDFSGQTDVFLRKSSTVYRPDPAGGDLIFNGVSGEVDQSVLAFGVQGDARYALTETHTLRGGWQLTGNRAVTDATTQVFAADAMGDQLSSVPFTVIDNHDKLGWLYGAYLQDEWKVTEKLTINYGLRADAESAYLHERQLSPRLNAVYQVSDATTVHAGYARYFTPPPLELVESTDVAKFVGTTNASSVTASSAVGSERAHYFDLGLSHTFNSDLSVTLDGYLKEVRNELDEGQFGQALIFSPFNYAKGQIEGTELGVNYTHAGFSAYANLAVSRATGETIVSGQFQFDPAELAYIATHTVYLDHDQRYTASAGLSYRFGHELVYLDSLYGSGLRRGFANTQQLSPYYPLNFGWEHTIPFKRKRQIVLRADVTNLFDQVYELRDGSGIGVGAPQYGARRGFYGSVGFAF